MSGTKPSKESRKMKTSILVVIAALADEASSGSKSAGHRYCPNVQAMGAPRSLVWGRTDHDEVFEPEPFSHWR
jgi:hypothetical protein